MARVHPWSTVLLPALLASLGGALLFCAVSVGAWFVYFSRRKRRSDAGSPSNKRRPSMHSSEAVLVSARKLPSKSVIALAESYEEHTKKSESRVRHLRERSCARSSIVVVDEQAKSSTSSPRMSEQKSDTLDMDHVYLSFRDYMWGMLMLAPNAILLQITGVSWLVRRQVMQRWGLLQPLPHDPRRTAAKLIIESFRAMHYASQRLVDGKRVATFLWHELPLLGARAELRVHSMFRCEVDLDERAMLRATLDERELTPSEAVVVLYFITISSDHVKIHALGNWACNDEQTLDPFLRRMSIVSVCYNYFGSTVFRFIAKFYNVAGLLTHDFRDLQEVFDIAVQQGVGAHAGVVELAADSEVVSFTIRLRNFFLNRFAEMRDQFPAVDGEALFASTVVHSIDHQLAIWNLPDPLWLEVEAVADEFKPMAEMGRLVRVGFVPALPCLLFKSRYRHSPHPFYHEIYRKAAKLNRRFADEMDACIVR